MNTEVSFSWSSGLSGLQGLRQEWQQLVDGLPDAQYYQRPQWFEAYFQICDHPDDVLWITARKGDRLQAVLPVQRARRRIGPFPLTELRLINHGHMTLSDACANRNSKGLWPMLWDWLKGKEAPDWDRLVATATPADGIWAGWMKEMLPSNSLHSVSTSSARTDCRRTLDSLLKACSANHRSNLSRGTKRIEAIGPMRYECANTPEALSRAFPVFLKIEASGWKGEANSAVASNQSLTRFYQSLLDELGSRGECEIDLLYVGEQPIATVLWFRTARELHLQKIGYLEEMSRLSPGKMLMKEAFARACADPTLDRLCFITHPDWAEPWKPESNPVLEFSLYRDSLLGTFLCRLNSFKRRAHANAGPFASAKDPELSAGTQS